MINDLKEKMNRTKKSIQDLDEKFTNEIETAERENLGNERLFLGSHYVALVVLKHIL